MNVVLDNWRYSLKRIFVERAVWGTFQDSGLKLCFSAESWNVLPALFGPDTIVCPLDLIVKDKSWG